MSSTPQETNTAAIRRNRLHQWLLSKTILPQPRISNWGAVWKRHATTTHVLAVDSLCSEMVGSVHEQRHRLLSLAVEGGIPPYDFELLDATSTLLASMVELEIHPLHGMACPTAPTVWKSQTPRGAWRCFATVWGLRTACTTSSTWTGNCSPTQHKVCCRVQLGVAQPCQLPFSTLAGVKSKHSDLTRCHNSRCFCAATRVLPRATQSQRHHKLAPPASRALIVAPCLLHRKARPRFGLFREDKVTLRP